MKKVFIDEAYGQKLAHDICKITSNVKEVKFKRGHIITIKDKEEFLKLGKEHFFILEDGDENLIHEEDAAQILFDKCTNEDFISSNISLGKIEFIANKEGYFIVDKDSLIALNALGDISAASINNYTYVKKGDVVAAMRIIPLFTTREKIQQINKLKFNNTIFQIKEIQIKKIALITTGSEVYSGKIKDKMLPKINEILSKFNLKVHNQEIIKDNINLIKESLTRHLLDDYDLILLSGGMSVDPDDLTPGAIKQSNVEIISYGSPIIPGSMFLLGYYNEKTVLGLPGGIIFEQRTALDLILPKIFLKEKYTKEDINEMCVGGLL